ncbi:MAG TPA: AIPR family protein [Candidatus Saccharimonadales bacterium]|nr:AIPR family protein [Candidatus Saccharimonadales bacterium]
MSNTDTVLLDGVLDDLRTIAPSELNDAQVFDLFAVEQVLKDYDLSNDELIAGLTDGAGDGGIDGFYTFADEMLVDEDFDKSRLSSRYALDLYIFQGKRASGFAETAFDKWTVSLPILLNLSENIDPSIYSASLIQRVEVFRDLLRQTVRKFPKITIHLIYSSKASTENIDPRVLSRVPGIEELATETVGGESIAKVIFQGARELLASARREPSSTLELSFAANMSKSGQNSYAGLIPIQDYMEFISDENGKIKKYLFESNVRDFAGNTAVNKAIRDTLASTSTPNSPDFWWLNNGITVLANEVTIVAGKFVIKDPQIVNGLQTSFSIHDHFANAPAGTQDDRLVLIKVIVTNDEDVRNSVIVATNSQTNLLPTAIRAADEMQRDIEQYFLANSAFYDRRKNFYKNLGKPADQIFSVPYLAQAILAIGFSEPDQARARPSTLIRRDDDYQRIFSSSTPMNAYLWMAKLQREVDKRIKTLDVEKEFMINMRFHLSMMIGKRLAGDAVQNPAQLSGIFVTTPNLDILLPELAEELKQYLETFLSENPGMTVDRAAKSAEFVNYLKTVSS